MNVIRLVIPLAQILPRMHLIPVAALLLPAASRYLKHRSLPLKLVCASGDVW